MTVTGRDIIDELVDRMRSESEPLRYSALAHGVYRVFLHREDFERLSPARRSLVEEAGRALDEELDRLNAHRTPATDQWGRLVQAASRLVKPAEPPLRRPPAGWVIELYPDEDEELLPGHIRITSELGQPPAQAILAGDPTHRVQPVGIQPAVTPAVAAPPAPAPTSQFPQELRESLPKNLPKDLPKDLPKPTPDPQATHRTAQPPEGGNPTARVSTAAAWGELTYRDRTGQEHSSPLVGELIRIGRGGRGAAVDVTVEGPDDISRTHLHLRRESNGAVAVKDVSRFGTTMDNVRIPPSLDGSGRDLDQWVPVGARAQFGLAGVIVLHFKRVGTP
jgi:pSer/pThr/pTyr-binding forkhead associated (FHA) protein